MVSGTYEFSPLRPIPIPKPGASSPRIINVPTIRDRLVQRMLVAFLINQYADRWRLPHSFSSMGGTDEGVQATVRRIAARIQPESYIVKADLSKYFDTISRDKMLHVFRKLVKHRSLLWLIERSIAAESHIKDLEHRSLVAKGGLRKGLGIRQGMPISPLAAYLFLRDADSAMTPRNFYRYVDDMLFISETKSDAVDAFQKYKDMAEARGLNIHPLGSAKTQLIGPRESFEFLGLKIDRSMPRISFKIPSASKKEIVTQAMAQSRIDPSETRRQKGWLISAATKAGQLTRNYESAYGLCDDWPDFRQQLSMTQLRMTRRIADELTRLRRAGDDETLQRVFGY